MTAEAASTDRESSVPYRTRTSTREGDLRGAGGGEGAKMPPNVGAKDAGTRDEN